MEKFSEEVITNEQVQKICGAVASHMGKWEGTREWVKEPKELYPMPSNDFEKALQAADYVASRKAILEFDFPQTETVALPVTENKVNTVDIDGIPLSELENYVINFGKHNGKTFKEIKPTGYLDWMCKQEDFFKKDTQAAARRYLQLLQEGNKTVVNNKNDVDNLPF
jgi:uncharacterized protein (DUF3820 family)